ncbi:hypothetical protein ABPG72_000393 [Tetrahymena utriculariae]
MKYLLTISFIICFSSYCLSENTECPLNLSCDSSDTSCQNELNQFQQCVSTKYQPISIFYQKSQTCLNVQNVHISETEEEDGEVDLEEIKKELNKRKEGQCLAKMISDCQASSNDSLRQSSINQINECISSTCQSSFDDLKKLNIKTECPLNLSCDSSDSSCQNELNQFQQCASTKCDSQKIQSQDIQEIFDCYYMNCRPTYQPFLSEILNIFEYLNIHISENEEVDIEVDLEEIKKEPNKSKEGQCLTKMLSD